MSSHSGYWSALRVMAALVAVMGVAEPVQCQDVAKQNISDYSKFALLQEGDVEQGKSLFMSERLGCSRCHRTNGSANRAAPDLSAVGEKFGRREIIESVLTPSARIAEGYETLILLMNDGKSITGIPKNVDTGSIQLLTPSGEFIQVDPDDVETQRTSATSIMPEGVHANLSKAEFNNLIEYLVSLKHEDSISRISHGMPRNILELPKQVDSRPIHGPALKFNQPVWLGALPGQRDTFLVIEHQLRRIWRLKTAAGTVTDAQEDKTLFLDLGPAAPNEGRLAALAFHPNFLANKKYYLLERVTLDGRMVCNIVQRETTDDGQRDSGREPRLLLTVPQTTGAHFGGGLAFGPDGFLYISFGDSGPQEDPNGHAQNRKLFLGKIVRIDIDQTSSDRPYAIPSDNPFAGDPETLPEIWALGFRAPWRLSFDRVTGDLWVGDVGQDRYEEVDIVRRGENLGWNVFEGFENFSQRYRRKSEDYTPPVFAYGRKYGPSVTGGFVYRADPSSSFYGKYIFGDYESRRIFALTQQDRVLKEVRQIGLAPQRIVSFGQDLQGNIYIVGYEGSLYRIDFSTGLFE